MKRKKIISLLTLTYQLNSHVVSSPLERNPFVFDDEPDVACIGIGKMQDKTSMAILVKNNKSGTVKVSSRFEDMLVTDIQDDQVTVSHGGIIQKIPLKKSPSTK